MKFVWIYIYIIFINIYIHIITRGTDCSPNVPLKLSSWSTPRFVKCKRTTQKMKVCSGQLGLSCDWIYVCCDVQGSEEKEHTHIYIACWGPTKQLYLYDSIWKLSVPQNRALGALSFPNRQMSLSRSTAMGSVTRKGSSSRLATVAFATCFPQLAILQWEAANVFDLWPVWFAMVPRLCWLRPQKRNPRLWIEILLKGEGYVYLIWCCGWFTLLDPLRNPI